MAEVKVNSHKLNGALYLVGRAEHTLSGALAIIKEKQSQCEVSFRRGDPPLNSDDWSAILNTLKQTAENCLTLYKLVEDMGNT